MQFEITCTAVVPYSTKKKVRTIGIDPRVLTHADGPTFIAGQMKLMMEELEAECDAAMKAAGIVLGDDGLRE